MKSKGSKTKGRKVKAKNVTDLDSKKAAAVKGGAINRIEPRYPK